MKSIKFLLGVIVMSVILVSCQNEDILSDVPSDINMKSVSLQGSANSGEVATISLLAGKTTNVGSLILSEVDTNSDGINDALSVTYSLTGGWLLSEVQFWTGTSLSGMPQTKTGNPQIGKFPYNIAGVNGQSECNFTISFSELNYTTCEAAYVAAAHATVYSGSRTETAWASGIQMNVKGSWAMYVNYSLVDNNAPVVAGSLPEITVEGCSVDDAPDAVSSVSELETLGLSIADTRTSDDKLHVTSVDKAVGSCPIEVVRTYTITDACGNAATVNQTINIEDTTAPELAGQGANATINAPAQPEFTAPTATDNCGGEVAVTSSDNSVSEGLNTVITRTWTATDACGNSASVSQTITVVSSVINNENQRNNNESGECTSWQTETAFGGEAAGSGKAWWFYYDGSGVETIWAGQNYNAGTVEFKNGYMQVNLSDGWVLQNVAEAVKIQGYDVLPTNRPAAGQFTTYKGSSVNVPVGNYKYYVVHLDVQKCASGN